MNKTWIIILVISILGLLFNLTLPEPMANGASKASIMFEIRE